MLVPQIISTIFALAVGSLLHFTYDWSGKDKFVSYFSSVSESTWEHLKLSFFGIFIVSIFEYLIIENNNNNFIESKTIASILSMILIVIFFYTYTGIWGKNYYLFDIGTFVLSVIISEFISYRIMSMPDFSTPITKVASLILLIFVIIFFVSFTNNPPNINLFKDHTK